MAHENPPHFRAALNSRELPVHRVERLWALQAELSTIPGLLQAASWLPLAWPHLLQLLADPHPDVRSAAAQLLGRLGALLAAGGPGGAEPRLAGRLPMPPTALLDWALAVLSPGSTLPAAQRMGADTKEAALLALHTCVSAMPPPAVAPFAQPLLSLTTSLLESSSTPPRLLGPLLRLLLAALPAVPLATLGQGFSDLADLMSGWALEPLAAPEDRQLITIVLHALRPQWHSHPDLTASLTENMFADVRVAAAAASSAVAAAAAGTSVDGTGGGREAAAQISSCLQLAQLLCDILSAASLRPLLPLIQRLQLQQPQPQPHLLLQQQQVQPGPGGRAGPNGPPPHMRPQPYPQVLQARPHQVLQPQLQAAHPQVVQPVVLLPQQQPPVLQPQPHGQVLLQTRQTHQVVSAQQLVVRGAPVVLVGAAQPPPLQQQVPLHPHGPPQPHSHHYLQLQQQQLRMQLLQQEQLQQQQQQRQQQQNMAMVQTPPPNPIAATAALPRPGPAPYPLLAMTAMLPTRPSAATVRHIITLYPRLLATLKEIRNSVVQLESKLPGQERAGRGSAAAEGDPWVDRLCRLVDTLADSVASCAMGIDPRDVDEAVDGVEGALGARLAALALGDEDKAAAPRQELGAVASPAAAAAAAYVGSGTAAVSEHTATAGIEHYGPVGSALAAVETGSEALGTVAMQWAAAAAKQGEGGAVRDVHEVLHPGGAPQQPRTQPTGPAAAPVHGRGESLRKWALQMALEWVLSLLSGQASASVIGNEGDAKGHPVATIPVPAGEGLAADTDVLVGCAVRLLKMTAGSDPRLAERLLVDVVIGGEAGTGVSGMRSMPRVAAVAAGAKLLQALLSERGPSSPFAAATLDFLLADLHRSLGLANPPPAMPRAVAGGAAVAAGAEDAASPNATAAAFSCAVLQAACQRGLLPRSGLVRLESVAWRALQIAVADSPAPLPAPRAATPSRSPPVAARRELHAGTLARPPSSASAAEPPPAASQPQSEASAPPPARRCALPASASAPNLTTSTSAPSAAAAAPAAALPDATQPPPAVASPFVILPPSVLSALCDTWSAAAVALLATTASPHQPSPATGAAMPAPAAAPTPAVAAAPVTAIRSSACAAYLHGLLGLWHLDGLPFILQMRLIAALRRLVAHPTVSVSGVLRSERLFRLATDVAAAGIAASDAGVRAAALDCAAGLMALVLQGAAAAAKSDGSNDAAVLAPPPPPPRPESFAPLMAMALEGMTEVSPDVAAASTRLAAELCEAALLTALRGPASASYGTWIPAWQDELAAAPQCRAPRPQQVARLLELVFQSAAVAAQGSGGAGGSVLLRKRAPTGTGPGGAGGGGVSADDSDLAGRMEALQRLALGLAAAPEGAVAGGGADGGGADSGSSSSSGGVGLDATVALARSGGALVWLAVHEGTKQLVANRLRTHLGGPTQTLGALERMLQASFSRLAQERREAGPAGVSAPSRDSAWLALELVGGLERAVAHAAEGHAGRDALPPPVLAFFAANKKVCEEWFTRSRELLARTAALASAHHHVLHHGLLRLSDLRTTMRQLLSSLAKERRAAAAAAAALAPPAERDGKGGNGNGSSTKDAAMAVAAPAAAVGTASTANAAEAPAPGQVMTRPQHGGKQLQRRPGAAGAGQQAPQQPQQQPAAVAAPSSGPAAADTPAAAAAAAAPSAAQQLEGNLSRLALAVVDLLKLVGAAMLACGEADSLQGLHTWVTCEFEPLLLGAHLPGASAVAAAAAAAAADALASSAQLGVRSQPSPGGGSGGSGGKRRAEAPRSVRGNSKQHKDAFSWLLGLSLQAAGSYEQALLSYNAFLAPSQPPTPTTGGGAGAAAAGTAGSTPAVVLELSAAAQGFVVERVGECYAALSDWSGLQGLMGAFSRTAATEPVVAGWWPAAAASIEHRFRALAAYDTASATVLGPTSTGAAAETVAPGDPTSALLASLRALEGTTSSTDPRRATPPPGAMKGAHSQAPTATSTSVSPKPQELLPIRRLAAQELDRVLARLRATALSEPAAQRQLLLQACTLHSALRGLDAATLVPPATAAAGTAPTTSAAAADGPWAGLLKPANCLVLAPSGAGLGAALLSADGTIQPSILRDVAVTAALLRTTRAADPRVSLPGSHAMSLEHIRAAAAGGNWGLAARLVQAAAARVPSPAPDAGGVAASGEGPLGPLRGGGSRAVWSVVHTLLSAATGKLQPGQVVDLQLRALLPHLQAAQLQPLPPMSLHNAAEGDDLACALCTLARWMSKAGATQQHQQQQHLQQRGSHAIEASVHQQPSVGASSAAGQSPPLPPAPHSGVPQPIPRAAGTGGAGGVTASSPGLPPGFAGGRALPPAPRLPGQAPHPAVQAPPWVAAADWPALSRQLLFQLTVQYSAAAGAPVSATGGGATAAPGVLPPAFAVPGDLLPGTWHAPAVCCLLAVQLSPSLARAWKAWGDLVYRATKEQRARTGRSAPPLPAESATAAQSASGVPPNDTSGGGDPGGLAAAGYGAATAAYCRYLALSYSHEAAARPEDVLPVLLQLLNIIVRHSAPLEALLAGQLAAVPPHAWATVTPQLLAQLPSATGAARRLLATLLHAVGRAAPSRVLYPAVVEVRAADAAGGAAAPAGADGESQPGCGASGGQGRPSLSVLGELRVLLADLGRLRPGLLAGVEVLVGEMERLTVLWDERWAVLLAEVEVEIARRAVSLQAEAARVADDASLTPEQRQALLAGRYTTLMAPAVMLLERQLRATASQPPETPHERRFAAAFLPRLRAAAAALRDGAGVRDWAKPQAAWAALRAAAAALARQQRQPLPAMADLSPRLAALRDSEVPMPGCQDDTDFAADGLASSMDAAVAASDGSSSAAAGMTTITVAGVAGEVVALNTKTRPKRVALVGSDGRSYSYLLKGREDLRMDERLMQVLRTINSMLQSDPAATCRDLASIRHYSVTPLGPRAGLIQWVPATTSLFAVFRQWQTATLERHAAMVAARQEGVVKAAAEGAPPPPEVEPPPPPAASRPMDLFYATLVPALQERGLSTATPRRNWPADLLRSVLASLTASAPQHLLARVLWAGGGSAATSWRRQQRYSRSLGVMSCVGHLLGLGDRHPDNILLEGRQAGVVHIDYNVCWDKGAKLRVPEVVPFRLTPMLRTALGVGGLEGTYRAACEATLGSLRRRREALVGLVDAVLSDPRVDWAVEREDLAARQDMELAVALNLFVSRAEEVQRQLQRLEDDLPGVVEGPAGALLAYVEAHVFTEALQAAANEAQQRIQQAKSALEAAGRAEAEARAIVAAAAQEAASLAAEGNALSAAVPQLLQQCGAWAQQHTNTLGVLREGSFLEGTAASGASWRLNESGCAMGLLGLVAGPGPVSLTAAAPLALLPTIVGGEMSALGRLPEELLLSCQEHDRQAADLFRRREAALADAISALTQYGTIVRKLLPPSYPGSSYHHRWAQALAALASGGLSLPAVSQAQAVAPREPRPLDVAVAWQGLRGSHRLATAAAVVLAPGSPEAVAAMVGHVGGARVSGRELAGAVGAAGTALAEAAAPAVAEAAARQADAGLAGSAGGVHELRAQLLGILAHAEGKGRLAGAGVAAVVPALLKLVQTAQACLQAMAVRCPEDLGLTHGSQTGAAAGRIADFARLGSEVTGMATVVNAVAGARLAAAVFGSAAAGNDDVYVLGPTAVPGAMDLGTAAVAAAAAEPLPWLAVAADTFGRWFELQQRLVADVAPELAGQLHVSSGGGGSGGGGTAGAPLETPLGQAAADLHDLLRPVEAALEAARDIHRRQEALAELVATFHKRRADLLLRLSKHHQSNNSRSQSAATADAAGGGGEPARLAAELQAIEAAWASRESVAADLQAAADGARGALAEALRELYASVRGMNRMPAELRAFVPHPAVQGGAEAGWAEAGSAGHAAVAALVAWWDVATEALEGVRRCSIEDAALGGVGSEAGSDIPVAVRPLWRCVEAARMAGQALRACQSLRLTAPPGTDGALSEAFGSVVSLLASQAAAYTTSRMLRCLQPGLSALVAHLAAVMDEPQRRWRQQEQQTQAPAHDTFDAADGAGGGGDGGADAEGTAGVEMELVPFTDFDPRVAGEGELLGGLEDEVEDAEGGKLENDVGGDTWEGFAGGDGDINGNDSGDDGGLGGADEGEGYDLDLELELDLDDGFGGDEGGGNDGDVPGNGATAAAAGGGSHLSAAAGTTAPDGWGNSPAKTAPGKAGAGGIAPSTSDFSALQGAVGKAVERLAACAAAAAVDTVATAADAAAAAATPLGPPNWVAGLEARATRATRLQRLAAFEFLHEHHLLQALPAGDPRVGQALTHFFAAQSADPLQPSARVTAGSRLALLTQLQTALDALPGVEAAVSGWEAASGGAVSQTVALLRGAPEQFPVDTALAAQRAGMVMGRRQQWLAESRSLVMRVCQVAEALLQFEYSRQGITWASGGAAVADGFASHAHLLGRAEVLATLAAGGSEAGRAAAVAEASQRAAEAARQAADARYALEVAQYEEVSASSQLQAHLPLLVSRSMDLAPAVADMEPGVRALMQLLAGKLGPALKELSAVAAQHSAAADVASVAAAVTSHFDRSRQAAEALAAALPATLAGLAAADAASPLPVEMATEVGFLSAQLLGGDAAAAATGERARALVQHMAAATAALQPVMHLVAELPRAVVQLDNELSTLAAAASSIAAAVESKHVLPAVDDQQPPQATPSQGLPQTSQQQPQTAGVASDTQTQAPSSGAVSDSQQQQQPAAGTSGTAEPSRASSPGPFAAAEGKSTPGASAGGTPLEEATTSGLSPAPPGHASRPGTATGYHTSSSGLQTAAQPGSGSATANKPPAPLPRVASAATAAAVAAPDPLQHHRSRRSAADEARRRAFAAGALRRFVAKLEGRESEGSPLPGGIGGSGGGGGAGGNAGGGGGSRSGVSTAGWLTSAGAGAAVSSVSEQVDMLIRQATSVDRLAQMYEGWSAWL